MMNFHRFKLTTINCKVMDFKGICKFNIIILIITLIFKNINQVSIKADLKAVKIMKIRLKSNHFSKTTRINSSNI